MKTTESEINSESKTTQDEGQTSSTDSAESSPPLPSAGEKRAFMRPLPGYVWNPLLKYPRNNQCPCLSGLKFKRCCLPNLPQAVNEQDGKKYSEQMKLPKLIFMTEKNKEMLQKAMAPYIEAIKKLEAKAEA